MEVNEGITRFCFELKNQSYSIFLTQTILSMKMDCLMKNCLKKGNTDTYEFLSKLRKSFGRITGEKWITHNKNDSNNKEINVIGYSLNGQTILLITYEKTNLVVKKKCLQFSMSAMRPESELQKSERIKSRNINELKVIKKIENNVIRKNPFGSLKKIVQYRNKINPQNIKKNECEEVKDFANNISDKFNLNNVRKPILGNNISSNSIDFSKLYRNLVILPCYVKLIRDEKIECLVRKANSKCKFNRKDTKTKVDNSEKCINNRTMFSNNHNKKYMTRSITRKKIDDESNLALISNQKKKILDDCFVKNDQNKQGTNTKCFSEQDKSSYNLSPIDSDKENNNNEIEFLNKENDKHDDQSKQRTNSKSNSEKDEIKNNLAPIHSENSDDEDNNNEIEFFNEENELNDYNKEYNILADAQSVSSDVFQNIESLSPNKSILTAKTQSSDVLVTSIDVGSRYACGSCDKTFKNILSFNLHIAFHLRMEMFPCEFCLKSFAFLSSLNEHMKSHIGIRVYFCPICKIRFTHKQALRKHIKFHLLKRRYNCSDCSKKFVYPHHFTLHKRIHRIDRPYFCNICSCKFTRESALQSHMKRHEIYKELMTCKNCKLCFNKIDCRIHHCKSLKEKSVKKTFLKRCTFCNKFFHNARSLKMHSCFTKDHFRLDFNFKIESKPSFSKKFSKNRSFKNSSSELASANIVKNKQCEKVINLSSCDSVHISNFVEKSRSFTLNENTSLNHSSNSVQPVYNPVFESRCAYCDTLFPNDLSLRYHLQTVHLIHDILQKKQPAKLLATLYKYIDDNWIYASSLAHMSKSFSCIKQEISNIEKTLVYGDINLGTHDHPIDLTAKIAPTENTFIKDSSLLNNNLIKTKDLNCLPLESITNNNSISKQLTQDVISNSQSRSKPEDCNLITNQNEFNSKLRAILSSSKSPKICQCIYCDKPFPCEKILASHLRTVHYITLEDKVPSHILSSSSLSDNKLNVTHDSDSNIANGLQKEVSNNPPLKSHVGDQPVMSTNLKINEKTLTDRNEEFETEFECTVCNKIFETLSELNNHKNNFDCIDPLTCKYCSKKFSLKKVLKYHEKHFHEEEQQYTCKYCNKSFRRKDYYKYHVKCHEEGSIKRKKHLCDICGKYFLHIELHKNAKHSDVKKKPFLCDICAKAFPYKGSLARHVRTHNLNEQFKCDQCPKSFPCKSVLKDHVNICHLNLKKFLCPLCNKRFGYKPAFNVHMRWHSGEKPYKCSKCLKSFSTSYSLTVHTKSVHTMEKNYHCEYCSKAFVTKYNMKVHVLTHFKQKKKSKAPDNKKNK